MLRLGFALWIALEGALAWRALRAAPGGRRLIERNWGVAMVALHLGGLRLAFWTAARFPRCRGPVPPLVAEVAGVSMMAAGIALKAWAALTLGPFLRYAVEIHA